MSMGSSPSTGLPYGVQRVCHAWDFPRSTYYAWKESSEPDKVDCAPARRGPKPKISDERLLEMIREDLAASPFEGEGYRKVHRRLQRQGHRVGSKRVNRLMRESHLLSPHRVPKGEANPHTGRISTDAPNVMWGTDGAKVETLEEGWCWLFVAVEHWNSECVGWHACKRGDRYAALEPIAQGLQTHFGGVLAGAARGLAVRMDNGPQYRSDHFREQLKFWGIAPSFAYVEEPQTNGVAERFIRTVREQVLNGRVFRNLDELRAAMADFIEFYNHQWLVEKMGYLSPRDARRNYQAAELSMQVAA
jgi:putative transposase